MSIDTIDIRRLFAMVLASAALTLGLFAISGSGGTTATASPGGLDSHGGHHCWTSCRSYGLHKGDYHCHRATKECRRANRRHHRHGH
jgi:hypothetical protein